MKPAQTATEGGSRKLRPAGWQIAAVGLFLFYMLLPIVSTYVFSVATRWDRTILPEGYTLEFYLRSFETSYFTVTLRNSLILSVATIVVSLIIIVPCRHAITPWIYPEWLVYCARTGS